MKPALFVLVVACIGLTAALVVIRQKAETRVQTVQARASRAVTDLEEARNRFSDLERLYAVQESALKLRDEELALASSNLASATIEATKLAADLKTIQADMLKRQERIAALESERDDLTKKMEELTTSIGNLEIQIADTKKKLASSESDKTFLLAELKRLQGAKDTLVQQFNSLAALRVQVARLKEEAAIKQRLEWKRIGVYASQDQKGAERLLARSFLPTAPQSRLDAELYQGGRIAPASTNSVTGGASSVGPAVTPP